MRIFIVPMASMEFTAEQWGRERGQTNRTHSKRQKQLFSFGFPHAMHVPKRETSHGNYGKTQLDFSCLYTHEGRKLVTEFLRTAALVGPPG